MINNALDQQPTNLICEKARLAINDALVHYLSNLMSEEKQQQTAEWIVDTLQMIQPYLMLTEPALVALMKRVLSTTGLGYEITMNLTVLFHQYFQVTDANIETYINATVASMDMFREENKEDELVPMEYRSRHAKREDMLNLLKSNKFLVMYLTLVLYIEPERMREVLVLGMGIKGNHAN